MLLTRTGTQSTTHTGSDSSGFHSGLISASFHESWGDQRQKNVSAQGSVTYLSTTDVYNYAMSLTSLTLSDSNNYTITSSNASLSLTRNDSANTYQLVGSGVLAIDIPSGSINGTVVIPANQTVLGQPYRCATSGTVMVQGVGGNVIININSGSYADVGLDANQDGVVDTPISTGTKVCVINFNYLK
jgi:hypothetical protein